MKVEGRTDECIKDNFLDFKPFKFFKLNICYTR